MNFTVECDTLPAFFEANRLSRSDRYFIKIDTEVTRNHSLSFFFPQICKV